MYKPATKLQLMVVRGLLTKWKMPVYMGFDQPMTHDLMWSIVKEIEGKGFRVWGATFDLGNKKFQSEFGLYTGTYRVQNPFVPDRWFYYNPDPPHLQKSFREHCLMKTYIIPKDPYSKVFGQPTGRNIDMLLDCGDYVKLGKDNFQLILDSDQAEFKIHHKLTPAHLEVANSGKCSVRMAAQVMSASSAAAMEFLRPDWKPQATAVMTVNNWFDVVNSRRIFGPNPLQCAYGKTQEEQDLALHRMEMLVQNLYWRRKSSQSKLPFEHGILANIRTTRGLLHDLKAVGYEYLLTSRTNQDCVENSFSCLRVLTKVASDPHPDRLQVMQRMKIRLLCADADLIVPIDKPSVEAEGLDTFVAVEVDDFEDAEPLPDEFLPPPLVSFDPPEVAGEEEVITSLNEP